jgi:hypothetical protein
MTPSRLRRIFFGAATLFAVGAAAGWWHGERVFARMQPTTCRLVVKSVESKLLIMAGGPRRIGSRSRLRYRDEARMVFAYTVDGRKYTFREDFHADEMPLDDYKEERAYPCRYDPQAPGRATITTAYDPEAPKTMLIMAAFLTFLGVLTPQLWRQTAESWPKMRERVW